MNPLQVTEITLGAQRKRPGPVPYSSEAFEARISIDVHPNDDVQEVVRRGQDLLFDTLTSMMPGQRARNSVPQ